LGASRVFGIGIFAILIAATFSMSPVFAYEIIILNPEGVDKLPQWMQDLVKNSELYGTSHESSIDQSKNKSEQYTKPTFGLDHENNQKIIDSGFKINNNTFSIKDNFHTPFAEQVINIGEENTFEAKIFSSKGLRVQEFLFGIPKVGEAHLAELGVEVWFDYEGEIREAKTVQKSNVIDEDTIIATHEKTKCKSSDIEEKCDSVKVTVVFLEPLKDKVMALKAIDYKNRYQITYLNEGVYVSGESLNPIKTKIILSNVKNKGLLKVTQVAKYSPYWTSEDGKMFEMNSFGSFKEINQSFERFQDTGNAFTRQHSEFGGILNYEQKRALNLFDSSKVISELPESFAHEFPETQSRMNESLKQQMLEQEKMAQKSIEEYTLQARWH
jgi:hypothetical protein